MPKLEVVEVGNLRAEVHQSNGRGVTVEPLLGRGGYRLSLFPHELAHLEALLAEVRASLKVPVLALPKRGSA
jgi:hypothetical protein